MMNKITHYMGILFEEMKIENSEEGKYAISMKLRI